MVIRQLIFSQQFCTSRTGAPRGACASSCWAALTAPPKHAHTTGAPGAGAALFGRPALRATRPQCRCPVIVRTEVRLEAGHPPLRDLHPPQATDQLLRLVREVRSVITSMRPGRTPPGCPTAVSAVPPPSDCPEALSPGSQPQPVMWKPASRRIRSTLPLLVPAPFP